MSSLKKINFKQLRTAVDWSISQMEIPRKNRVNAIKEYVGNHYARGGSDKRVPTNMLELAITIYTRQLAARAPRAMVSTPVSTLRPFARNMELALNQIPEEINLGATLRRIVLEALFSIGIAKVGIAANGNTVLDEVYGEPFVDHITLDDYFCDMSAKKRDNIQFEGNDYWLPLDTVRGMWGSDIGPDDHTVTGDQGEERAESVSQDEGADLYKDKVWLRDIWIPDTGQVLTYGVKSRKLRQVVDWDGPEHGPYHVLGFSEVPGNLLPLPPVALWIDMHELANSLFRKLGRQAEAKKTVAAFQGNDEDAEALKKADDGDGIAYHGQKPENITVGGIDQPTFAFYLQIRDLFSYFAGNLDSLGGLSPMTDTVGQDKLLSDAASARVNYMKDETVKVYKDIFKALAWYEWTDPVRERIIEKPIKGTDIVIRSRWSAETREGDFLDYNTDIDVYSMQDDTPAIKLQKIRQAFEGFIVPYLPMIQAQGGQLDWQSLLSLVSKYGDIPELEDIIRFLDPGEQQQAQGNPQPSAMPANTTRTYERVNRPGATRSGKDDVMSRLLMGGNVQGSEAAALGRMVN